MSASIRVHFFDGDLDDIDKVFLIGPYATGEDASAEAARLNTIARYGSYTFEVTDLTSKSMAEPAAFSSASTEEEFDEAFDKHCYA